MKAGILTYHNAINYGAVLQAYALQKTILNLGVECEIINYKCPAVEKQYRRKRLSDCAYWKVYLMDFISGNRLEEKRDKFRKFSDKYLRLSEEVGKEIENADKYDVIISGSDQVFNPKNTEGDSIYLLDFKSNAKKISYAASIGNPEFLELWKSKYNIDYKSLLKEFDKLSFREKEATEFVSELIGKSSETVLDPVLMAGKSVWHGFLKQPDEEYIFVYNLGNISLMLDFVKEMRKKTGLKTYVVNKDIKGDFLYRNYVNVSSISPEEFVNMICGAKYVITDSFHGTAFSLLFHKNFFSVVNPHKNNTNSRIANVLKMFNLEERIVNELQPVCYNSLPDYDLIDNKIEMFQNHSIDWLCNALQLKKEREY